MHTSSENSKPNPKNTCNSYRNCGEDWLCQNIVNSKCKSYGKVCSSNVSDNGSCEKVSHEMEENQVDVKHIHDGNHDKYNME